MAKLARTGSVPIKVHDTMLNKSIGQPTIRSACMSIGRHYILNLSVKTKFLIDAYSARVMDIINPSTYNLNTSGRINTWPSK